MTEPEKTAKRVLVYDPSNAIASFYARPLKEEGIELFCTLDLKSFQAAVSENKYDGLITLIDHDFNPENESQKSLEETVKVVVEAQKKGDYPLLIDFVTNFRRDGYNEPLQSTRSAFDSGLKPLELPYTKKELLARFSSKTFVLQRAYNLEKLKKYGLDLMFPPEKSLLAEAIAGIVVTPPQNPIPTQREDGTYIC